MASPDGSKLYVPCAAVKSTVCVVDAAAHKVIATLAAGHTATGAALTPDGKRLYVSQSFQQRRIGARPGGRQGIGPRASHPRTSWGGGHA